MKLKSSNQIDIIQNRNMILICVLLLFMANLCESVERCRFAHHYTMDQVVKQPQPFLQQFVHWQTKFMKAVGIQETTGLTYDGYRLDMTNGELLHGGLHYWTASSKECIHVGILANILQSGKQDIYTYQEVFSLLKRKTQTYEQFFKKYPGFGGYMPWVFVNGSSPVPTPDFANRTPALDNGELFWAAVAVSHAWKQRHADYSPQLRERWDNITWKLMIKNLRKVFFNATTGKTRAVSTISNISKPVQQNTYSNKDNYYLDDPYEGQLFTWIFTLFPNQTGFTQKQIDFIWQDKRNKLKSVDYVSKNAKSNITVEKGWWFSAHEQWKNLFMPYLDVDIYHNIQKNNEKARTWHSADQHISGMFASVTGPAKNNTQNMDYYSDCGIQSICFQKIQHTHMVTPYSTFPLFLVSKSAGAAWLHNMLSSPTGQTIYGAIEATSIDGKDISPVMTWDSKITTVLAIMGGNRDIIRNYLKQTDKYGIFIDRITKEYTREFTKINGLFLDFALPTVTIKKGRPDFPNCKV